METLELAFSTRNQQVDAILRGTIGLLEILLPGRVRACYLHGSFIDGTGIETSDIDLFLVARATFSKQEREKIQALMHNCALFSPLMVEIIALDEASVLRDGHFRIQAASQLLWGDDLRAEMPAQTLEQYVRMYARFPFVYIAPMLRQTERLVAPLTYPQPTGEFYGYDQQALPPRNEPRHNIKKLVTGVCWAATLLLAWQAGKTVPGKHASVQMYRECINDEWATFIEEMYTWGNQRWRYLVPQNSDERQHLREMCAQTLAFEQHYLRCYQAYLLAELSKDATSSQAAMQQLREIYLDAEQRSTLGALVADGETIKTIVQDR